MHRLLEPENQVEPVPRLALRPCEAAQALGISKRTLELQTEKGDIPHFRIGRAILYPVDALREYLAAQVTGNES